NSGHLAELPKFKPLLSTPEGVPFSVGKISMDSNPLPKTFVQEHYLNEMNGFGDVKGGKIEGTPKAANVGSVVKDGNKMKYTNPAGNELTWVDQHPKNISRDIETFLNSLNIGKATEGKVAKFVSEQKEVTGLDKRFRGQIKHQPEILMY
ncbi:hypothetical protein BSK65_29905, partial [Paenibacillus odorifer]